MSTCIICGLPVSVQSNQQTSSLECVRCGNFQASPSVVGKLGQSPPAERTAANLSGYLRENPSTVLTDANLDWLLHLSTPPVSEKAERLFQHLSREYPTPGQTIRVALPHPASQELQAKAAMQGNREARLGLELLSAAWAQDADELRYLLFDFLIEAKQFLWADPANVIGDRSLKILPAGWAYLETVRPNKQSTVAFAAMNFAPELTFLFDDGIAPACEAAGYEPKRIDRHEHANRIDDEIIAMLRRSRFCIADLTGQRQNVYYEAGYAQGFGLPVIWSCRMGEENDVKFDTRQYNLLSWEKNKLGDFQRRLQSRIEAVIGVGPRQPQTPG